MLLLGIDGFGGDPGRPPVGMLLAVKFLFRCVGFGGAIGFGAPPAGIGRANPGPSEPPTGLRGTAGRSSVVGGRLVVCAASE